ncbi:MAG: hypothetical protein ACRDSL_07685 [Pseudonocardiaceae bacterium]
MFIEYREKVNLHVIGDVATITIKQITRRARRAPSVNGSVLVGLILGLHLVTGPLLLLLLVCFTMMFSWTQNGEDRWLGRSSPSSPARFPSFLTPLSLPPGARCTLAGVIMVTAGGDSLRVAGLSRVVVLPR